jgi:putative ABC transport system ATP-binding protein
MSTVIELDHVHRRFDVGGQVVHALDNIQLTIAQGDYLSLMGPSGSGKSTLLNIIGLLDRPSEGLYRLDGQDVTAYSDDQQARIRREQIGFVFQFFHLVPRLSAAENIELPMILAGIEPEVRKPRVTTILEEYGLSDRAHHRPEQLSGGQRQRVAIGRATVMQPKVLLADEPTGNLDRHSGHEVVEILERLQQTGITLIVVTHDPELGQRADRQLHMVDGAIVDEKSRSGP